MIFFLFKPRLHRMLDDVDPCFRWRVSSSWRVSATPSSSRSVRSSRWLTTKEKAGRRVFLRYVSIISSSSTQFYPVTC